MFLFSVLSYNWKDGNYYKNFFIMHKFIVLLWWRIQENYFLYLSSKQNFILENNWQLFLRFVLKNCFFSNVAKQALILFVYL